MDNQIPTPPPSENPASSPISSSDNPGGKHSPVPNGTGKGLFLEVIFVAVFLAILFGVLNYFNILKLSKLFPNQLGFLPRREIPTGTSQQDNNTTIPSTVSPSDQAKQALASLLLTIITPSFVPKSPSDITVFQGKTAREESRASWEARDGNQSARFISSTDGKQIIQLYILFDYNSNASVSADLTKETVSQFFSLVPKEPFSCKLLSSKANYCESFWEEPNGTKRGIGMHEYKPFSSRTNKTTVFFCQFKKDSKSYSWKSCASEFSQTGVTP